MSSVQEVENTGKLIRVNRTLVQITSSIQVTAQQKNAPDLDSRFVWVSFGGFDKFITASGKTDAAQTGDLIEAANK